MIYATGIFNVSGHLITSFLTLEEFVRLISTSGKWMHDDRKIVDKFGQKPWIHHKEVLNCWSKLLWFKKRGARLRYSPWPESIVPLQEGVGIICMMSRPLIPSSRVSTSRASAGEWCIEMFKMS